MDITLPSSVSKREEVNAKNMIIFSKPKVGKTQLLSMLPACLLLDLENGSNYVDAMKIKIDNVAHFKAVVDKIIASGKPYRYIAVDTVTALEEMCIPYAEQIYAQTPMGKNWFTDGKKKYGSILNLPNGAGYPYLREAFTNMLDHVKNAAPHVIFLGHIKDTLLEKNGSEFTGYDLDLTGKLKRITASNVDAIGYLYRKGKQNILSFNTTDEIACGARPEHLRNKEIVVSEIDDKGEYKTYWDKIFINS